MGSNEREDQTTTQQHHHPPHISSLVVRTSGSDDGEVDRLAATGEVSRDRLSFPRSDRHKSDNGHRTRASSTSPLRRPYEDQRHSSDRNHSGARGRRESSGRYREYSPPHHAGGRRFDGPETAHGSFKGDGMSRNNNSKVQPRDGDWYCLDPLCRNLNFARREECFKCKRNRYARPNSPPPPRHLLPLSPRRDFNGYRSSPPRGYLPPRLDHPTWRDRDRVRYSDLEYPPSRRIASDWVHHQPLPNPHHFERRPPLSPPRVGRWRGHSRERSRSPPMRDGPPPHPMRGSQPLHPMRSRSPPFRDGPPPLRDYRHDSYFDRHGGRDRM